MNDSPPTGILSLVCPAYEEVEALPLFHRTLLEALEPLAADWDFEILYVDDGSRDGTLEVIRSLAADDARVKYLSLSRNFGHQAALTAGLEHARGDLVISLDTDLQHPPSLIPTLVERSRQGFDVVVTIRADDRRLGWFKRYSSRAFYELLSRCSDLDVRAAASDFRLLSRRALEALLRMPESHRYLRGMVQWLGFATSEVPFDPDVRRIGTSKYTLRRMIRFASDGLYSFSPMPVRLAVGAGLVVSAFTWVVCLVAILALIPWADPIARVGVIGLTALQIAVACVLVTAGVIGEYARRMYQQVKARPNFVIKESNADAAVASARLSTNLRPPLAA